MIARRLLATGILLAASWLTGSPAAFAQSSPSPFTSATRYDVAGRVTGTISPDPDAIGSGSPFLAVRNTYDPAGRLVKMEEGSLSAWHSEAVAPAAWSGFTVYRSVETTYDVMDRKQVETVKGSDGVAVSLTQFSYDGAGRLQCSAVRMNPAAYGSLPASACALGAQGNQGPDRITKNLYDAAGHLVQVRKGVGTAVEIAEVTYSYTPNGKREYVIDANGNRAKLEYDGLDRQVKWVFPWIGRPSAYDASTPANALASAGALNTADYEEYGYDANANRTSLRKRDGSVLTYSYDALGRMTTKVVPERAGLSATHTRDVHYGYDLRGLQTYARFDSAYGEGVTVAYDGFGRKTGETLVMDGVSRTIGSAYDANGNRTTVTYPGGGSFSYGYDGLGRFTGLGEGAATNLLNHGYKVWGGLQGRTAAGSAHDTVLGHDAALRNDSYYIQNGSSSHDVSWFRAFSPASQITSELRTNDLYAWTGHVNLDRDYVTNGLNQYTAAGGASFAYDANGNLTGDGTNGYLYDIENRLVARSGGGSAGLRYDPLGRLYEVAGGALGTQRFLYDGDALVAEYDSNGMLLRRYVHGADAGADDPLLWYEGSTVSAAARRYLYADPRGSIILTTDASGSGAQINAYDEYGIPDDATSASLVTRGRFRYTGQTLIPELGLYYYKARMYSPTLGRFLQTDPIGYDDGPNIYAYVGNDPVNNTDPTGEVIDTIADVAFLIYDGYKIATEGATRENVAAAGADAAAIFVPFATGAGAVVRGGSHAVDAARAADNVRPSTLRPGPNARESIPAQPGRPTSAQQREINRMGDRNGCHTCGTRESGRRGGNWTGDHQPPNRRNASGRPQRFFPHCANCSARQGAEVRNANRGTPPPPQPRPPRRRPED